MSHIQQVPDVRVHIDQLQVTTVSPGGNKDAEEAAETSAVNVIDATHIGLHVFMARRKALYRCLELDGRFEDEAAAADQSRRAFGGYGMVNGERMLWRWMRTRRHLVTLDLRRRAAAHETRAGRPIYEIINRNQKMHELDRFGLVNGRGLPSSSRYR